MSYPLGPDPWVKPPQTVDRIVDENGEVLLSSVGNDMDRNSALAEQWFNSGFQKAMQSDMLGAISDWDKAIEFKPDDHDAWTNRGNSLSALGRNEEAIASYDKAIEFKPDLHEAWYNRGSAAYIERHWAC